MGDGFPGPVVKAPAALFAASLLALLAWFAYFASTIGTFWDNFGAGQAVFHQAWQGSLAIANNPEKSKIAPNADYLLLPDKHFTWSLPGGIGISTYTKYPKAVEEFIEFMISEEVQLYTYETHGMFPALKDLFQRLGAEGKIDGFETMSEQAKYLIPLPYNTPWYSEFNSEATKALVRAARGEQTADQAIKALADYQRKLKKEYE